MPFINEFSLKVEVDHVLTAQGMNPVLVCTKHPRLVKLAEKAIEIGSPVLEPKVIYEQFKVTGVQHNSLELSNAKSLHSSLIVDQLATADSIIAAVCTVGAKIDELIAHLFPSDPALAVAVEGFASAATEILANSVCRFIETNLTDDGMNVSSPLNPGMVNWSVEEGQPQVFSLVNSAEIGVHLEPGGLMIPLKSLSMVIGIGSHFDEKIDPCELCNLKKTCSHRHARISKN